jgi:hypothetical protein
VKSQKLKIAGKNLNPVRLPLQGAVMKIRSKVFKLNKDSPN